MKRIISFTLFISIKYFACIFYRFKVNWLNASPNWKDIKLLIFLNHTSLYEPLFIGPTPISFIWRLSAKLVAPGADKTLNRPLVGKFWRMMGPGMVSISRKRDHTWRDFTQSIAQDSIIAIAPEGRMKRPNGKDLYGRKMNVRGGIAEIIRGLKKEGNIMIAYSGGLHHVQVPGQKLPKLFKTLKMNIELFSVEEYLKQLQKTEATTAELSKAITDDLQFRLETKCP